MAGIPLEAAIAIAGWACGVILVFIGWRYLPVWVKNRQAAALKDKNDPVRVNLGGAIKEDVLPDICAMVREEVARVKVPTLAEIEAAAGKRYDALLKEVQPLLDPKTGALVQLKEFREAVQPLLQTTEIELEDGKTTRANAILVSIDSVVQLANALLETTLIEVKDDNGQLVKAPIGPNMKRALIETLTEYEASRKGKAMQVMSHEARERKAEEAGREMAEQYIYAQENPELAAQGIRIQKLEKAADEWLDKANIRGEASRSIAKEVAAKLINEYQSGGALPQRQGVQRRGGPSGGAEKLGL